MNDFLLALPWRLSSLAALVVGIVSFATGGVDVWTGLERVGLTFVSFFIIGWLARALLSAGESPPKSIPTSSPNPIGSPSSRDRVEKDPSEIERGDDDSKGANASI